MADLSALLLGSRTITAVLSDVVLTEGTSAANVAQAFWDGLEGINALTVDADFRYVSGGTTAILTVDTAQGAGGVWRPVMRFDFAQTAVVKWMTIVRAGQVTAATLVTPPAAEGAINFLGDRFRARLTTTGVYSGGTLIDVRATPAR